MVDKLSLMGDKHPHTLTHHTHQRGSEARDPVPAMPDPAFENAFHDRRSRLGRSTSNNPDAVRTILLQVPDLMDAELTIVSGSLLAFLVECPIRAQEGGGGQYSLTCKRCCLSVVSKRCLSVVSKRCLSVVC